MHTGKREILSLKVKCDNFEGGCTWVGTVGTLEEHVARCECALLPCPKECKAPLFMRMDLDRHLNEDCPNRDYTCRHCEKRATYIHITQDHYQICPKKLIGCPNSMCDESIQRQHVQEHVDNECEFTIVPCKYRRIGCDTEFPRRQMVTHENDDSFHLHMAINTTVQLRRDLCYALGKIEDLEKVLKNGEPIKFKFTGFHENKETNSYIFSPSYYISPNGYRMAIGVYANGVGNGLNTHVSVYALVLEGRYDNKLKWPFVADLTFTLLNQLEDNRHHERRISLSFHSDVQAGDRGAGLSRFIHHSYLEHDYDNGTQFLKDDTLFFRLAVRLADHKPWLE